METSRLSFLSEAEKLTFKTYHYTKEYSIAASEVFGRLTALIVLSPAAAFDLTFHSLFVLPTFTYAIGKSIYQKQADFLLPWQHIQRMRNAVAPLFLSSIFGLLHPLAGIGISEASDKHAVIGMLSSFINQANLETVCSPIHSLSIIENIAKKHRYANLNGVQKEIFSAEHIKVIKSARKLEESLESLQAQESIHKITNLTLFAMDRIVKSINSTILSKLDKRRLIKASGILIPIFTIIDTTITLLAQSIFLATGLIRLVSGRGPIYTEATLNPLMHASFLIQNIIKSVGNLIGMVAWFASPNLGFKISLLPAHLFFKLQMNILMQQIKWKMHFAKDNSRFSVPILFGRNDCTAFSFPTHSMHKTYLIVEKQGQLFNLYWVNRPNITKKEKLDIDAALTQIRSMLNERFPFMDIEKVMKYPVKMDSPKFSDSVPFAEIARQGSKTNCVVSNVFGMLKALDKIRGDDDDIGKLRYTTVRKSLMNDYGFYKDDFFPFADKSDNYSLKTIWSKIEKHPNNSI